MIATRITESYASLFLTSRYDDGSRYVAIARIGAFEVRLIEMASGDSPEEAIEPGHPCVTMSGSASGFFERT
jgi:hypothetical protein